jgi:glycosyltransferase involved in cell wall biosynthesis
MTQFYMGLGIPPKDPKALAEAIGRVLDNPNEAKQMGNAGANAVREVFNSQKAATAVEQIYDEVMET